MRLVASLWQGTSTILKTPKNIFKKTEAVVFLLGAIRCNEDF